MKRKYESYFFFSLEKILSEQKGSKESVSKVIIIFTAFAERNTTLFFPAKKKVLPYLSQNARFGRKKILQIFAKTIPCHIIARTVHFRRKEESVPYFC